MFNTKEITTNNNFTGKYLNPGQYLVKINKVTSKTASSGNSQLLFEVETEPVTQQGFTPAEGHNGQVGTVKTVYINNTDMEKQVATAIAILATELGVKEQVDAIPSEYNVEQYCEALSNIVCNGEYVYMTINGRQYINQTTGKTGIELQMPKFKMFASKTKVEEKGIDKALTKPYIKELPKEEAKSENVW